MVASSKWMLIFLEHK